MSNRNKLITGIRGAMVLALVIVIIFTQVRTNESSASIAEVEEGTISGLDMSSLEAGSNRLFKKYYGLNANDYDSLVFYTGVGSMDVDEILIVKMADENQSDELSSAINDRLETLKDSFENYGTDQYSLLVNSILDVQGNYLLYIVHPDAVFADQGFRNSL